MQRRRFLFWLSLGIFEVGETLGLSSLDRLAAAMLNTSAAGDKTKRGVSPDDDEEGASEDDEPEEEADEGEPGEPDPQRRARDGRPPSRWLRSLNAGELRIWLPTIDPPESGVSGMTFWTHLTRDHSFAAEKIKGLTLDEQAKLHAAAHDGY